MSLVFLVIVSFFTHHCMSHTYSSGSCPNVEPIPDFDMTKVYMRIIDDTIRFDINFLISHLLSSSDDGMLCRKLPPTIRVWFIILKKELSLVNTFWNKHRNAIRQSWIFLMSLTILAKLRPTKIRRQWRLIFRWVSLNFKRILFFGRKLANLFFIDVAGSASFDVVTTDYETYAGIYTCQNLLFFKRHSATFLSRTNRLDEDILKKVNENIEISIYSCVYHQRKCFRWDIYSMKI